MENIHQITPTIEKDSASPKTVLTDYDKIVRLVKGELDSSKYEYNKESLTPKQNISLKVMKSLLEKGFTKNINNQSDHEKLVEAYKETANEIANAITAGELPPARTLYQTVLGDVSTSIYSQAVSKIYNEEKLIEVGDGEECGLVNGFTVSTLDDTAFIPSERNDPDQYQY
jgi:primosomal protein N'